MKNSILFAGLILLAASCSSESDVTVSNPEVGTAPVSVRVNNFTVEQGFPGTRGLTRTTSTVADYAGVKAITLAFYKSDGSQECCTTQLRADDSNYDTFGEFSLSLPYGEYTMIVLGYGSEVPIVLTSKTSVAFGEEKSRETFVYTQAVTVSNSTAVNLSATLERINSRLVLQSTDGRPADLDAIRITFSKGGKGFNPMTGLATSDDGFVNTVETSVDVGTTTSSITNFFLASDEETMNVTIETLDADENILFSQTVNDVPFKRNRATFLTGSMYSSATSAGFSVSTDYLTGHYMDF